MQDAKAKGGGSVLCDMVSVTGVLSMKTINYKWIGGNNLRKRTDGERTKRNRHIASFRMSCLFASLCRMCSGYYRFKSVRTTVYGYLGCFFLIFFAINLCLEISYEIKQPVFDKKSHFIIHLLFFVLLIIVGYLLSFAVVYLKSDGSELNYDIHFFYYLLYSFFPFGTFLIISVQFIITPINRTAKEFRQNYHDSRDKKRK